MLEISEFLDSLSLSKVNNLSQLIGDITEQEVASAINRLNNGKAPGLDGLMAEFYKHFATFLSPLLAEVFNSAFKLKKLSATQCLAIIVLLFKKGDTEEAGNYRPISLTNVDYKILTYVLTARLEPSLDKIIHPS